MLLGNNNGGARTIFRTVTQYNAEGPDAVSPFYITAITTQPGAGTGGHPAAGARPELHHRQRLRVRV